MFPSVSSSHCVVFGKDGEILRSFHLVLNIKLHSVALSTQVSGTQGESFLVFLHFFLSEFGLREGRLTVLRDWGLSSGHTTEDLCHLKALHLSLWYAEFVSPLYHPFSLYLIISENNSQNINIHHIWTCLS